MSRPRRAMAEINVVPYIDVMLVLLIIFMVAAPLINPGQIDLPQAAQKLDPAVAPLEVRVRMDGEIAVVDQNEQSADWLFSGYYTRHLRVVSRDAWRSISLAARRVRLAFARLVSSRSKRHHRSRRQHYSAPAESNRRVRFSGYRTPNGATPVVGDVGSRDPAARTPI